MNCLLCESHSSIFEINYFECSNCQLVFKNPEQNITKDAEYIRYEKHQNNLEDQKYVNYLKQLIAPIESLIMKNWTHLDFGSGSVSVHCSLLKDKVHSTKMYDLFFHPDNELLNNQYDLVTCSEVVEHFRTPGLSWEQLISTVKAGGILAIMTNILTPAIEFNTWWYKNDSTHFVFYQMKTIEYLCKKYNLEVLSNDKKSIIIFKKTGE